MGHFGGTEAKGQRCLSRRNSGNSTCCPIAFWGVRNYNEGASFDFLSCRIISVTVGMSIIHQGVEGGDVVSELGEKGRLNPLPIDLGPFNVT